VYGDILGTLGGFAEYVCARGDVMALRPPGLSFEAVSTIPQAGIIAFQGIRSKGQVQPGQKVLINGAGGGTGVGKPLLDKIAQAFPRMKREAPELRLILVAGPRLSPDHFPKMQGLEVRPYVHNLFEHLACCDLALVQGGLSTTMELVATRRPFLSFPLQRHFEQCVHVRRRLANYGADRSVSYAGLTPDALAQQALEAMHAPVRYKPVETDGAARAARQIALVLENRHWVRR